jgi:hypothetical protein
MCSISISETPDFHKTWYGNYAIVDNPNVVLTVSFNSVAYVCELKKISVNVVTKKCVKYKNHKNPCSTSAKIN